MKDRLIQVKLKHYGEYDIIKAVYQNTDTCEFNVVETVKEEKEFIGKDDLIDRCFTFYDGICDVEFDIIANKYKIPKLCKVYFATKRNRLCTYVEK